MKIRKLPAMLIVGFLGTILASVVQAQNPSPSPSPSPLAPRPELTKIYNTEAEAKADAARLTAQFGESKIGTLTNACDGRYTHPAEIRNEYFIHYSTKNSTGGTIWRVTQTFLYRLTFQNSARHGKENFHPTCTGKVYKTGEDGWSKNLCVDSAGRVTEYTDAVYSSRIDYGTPYFKLSYSDPAKGNEVYSWTRTRLINGQNIDSNMYFKQTHYYKVPPCTTTTSTVYPEQRIDDWWDLTWNYKP